MAHQALDEWLEGLKPLFEHTESPTLMDLSAQFMRTRGTLLGACLEALSEQLYSHYQDQHQGDCPGCGKCLNRKRVDPKTVTTLHGPMTLQRPYFHCRDCEIGFHPLDEIELQSTLRSISTLQRRSTQRLIQRFERASKR